MDWNLVDRQLTSTPELERLYGLEPGTLRTYEDLSARIHPDDLLRIEAERDEAIIQHRPFKREFRILHPSGETRWIQSRWNAVYYELGHPTRVLDFNIDITDRKRLEERTLQPEANIASVVSSTLRPAFRSMKTTASRASMRPRRRCSATRKRR